MPLERVMLVGAYVEYPLLRAVWYRLVVSRQWHRLLLFVLAVSAVCMTIGNISIQSTLSTTTPDTLTTNGDKQTLTTNGDKQTVTTNGDIADLGGQCPDETPSAFTWPAECAEEFLAYAIMSTNTNTVYTFTLPIAALTWRRVCVGTIALLIGDEAVYSNNPQNRVMLKHLRQTGAMVRFLPVTDDADTLSLAQTGRLFVSGINGINLRNDSYLVTTDVDLLAFNRSNHISKKKEEILLYNSRCCGTLTKDGSTYTHIPMHTIGMATGTWREMMGIAAGSMRTARDIESYLAYEFPQRVRGRAVRDNMKWHLDEHIVSNKMHLWKLKRNNTYLVKENTMKPRIDRRRWPSKYSSFWRTVRVSVYADTHLPHPSYGRKWASVRKLLRLLLPTEQVDWLNNYHRQFVSAN